MLSEIMNFLSGELVKKYELVAGGRFELPTFGL
jgi:hypothetical protein